MKPHGFWVSDEDDYGWHEWCNNENFYIENLKVAHEITLHEDANILYIRSVEALDEFTERYRLSPISSHQICWAEVAKEYQGIIITPYLWERRLDRNSSWYYGWDVASGCIWDAKAIKSIKVVKWSNGVSNGLDDTTITGNRELRKTS